jgi:hypothetical protein
VKKHLNFIGLGVEPRSAFLDGMRRTRSREALFEVCAAYLEHDRPMRLVAPSVEEVNALS